MSLVPSGRVECDFDLGVEFSGGPSDGVHYKIILYMDCATWHYLMLKKGLHPLYLRWFLRLQDFNFEVHDKVRTRAVTSPSLLVISLLMG